MQRTNLLKELRDLQVEAVRRERKGLPLNEVAERIRQFAYPDSNPRRAEILIKMARNQDLLEESVRSGRIKVFRLSGTQ